ncbi:MAG: c-type cytochrome, partial [Acidobacteriota bacterium]
MSIRGVTAALLTLAFVATFPGSGSAAAQQDRPELPDSVKEWLARDQPRRWAGLLEAGERLFSEGSCTRCHGQGGTDGRFGPDLTDQEWVQGDGSLAAIRWTILWGVRKQDLAEPERPFMLPYGGMDLSGEDLDAVTAYVWSLANGTY